MNRKKFIKNSLFVGAGLGLGSATFKNETKDFQTLCIYDNYIRGTNYYLKHIDTIDFTQSPAVELVREKDNHYDSFAIAIHINDQKVGYIAAYENIILANLLDEGADLQVKVKENPEGNSFNHLFVQVFMPVIIKPSTPLFTQYPIRRADDAVDEYRDGYRF